jgi:AhpC/TSA family
MELVLSLAKGRGPGGDEAPAEALFVAALTSRRGDGGLGAYQRPCGAHRTRPIEERHPMALLSVGDSAPAFTLQNQDGRSVSLSDFRGKTVVFWFYPRADTPG